MNLKKTLLATGVFALLLLAKISSAETVSYQYDNFGQLEDAQYGSGLQLGYVYDSIGNRETFTLTAAAILAGDINGDAEINLIDVIFGLKVTSGEPAAHPISKNSDINGNNRIGMEEVIYIMQKMAEQ